MRTRLLGMPIEQYRSRHARASPQESATPSAAHRAPSTGGAASQWAQEHGPAAIAARVNRATTAVDGSSSSSSSSNNNTGNGNGSSKLRAGRLFARPGGAQSGSRATGRDRARPAAAAQLSESDGPLASELGRFRRDERRVTHRGAGLQVGAKAVLDRAAQYGG
eukprot:SAG11_NODE_8479_length_1010_cov_1.805708_1_plen_163_part_10